MANRNGKHLLHVRSNQLIEGKPKLPTIDVIDYGEIAINYADGNEKISIKSSSDNIRTISTDEQNELKFETKERVAEIDEVVSKAFDTMNKSCGFDANMYYTPQNELISNTSSLSEAIEIVADKANNSASNSDLELYLTKEDASSTYATKEEIPDVSEYITKDVSGLTNYYDKADIDKKITEIKTLKAVVIEVLPESGETDTLYLVPNSKEEGNNIKDEYMWINGKWELIGSTEIDLTPYLTKEEASSTYATKEEINVIDEVVSKAFDTLNKSCGFNENAQYAPQNNIITDAKTLSEAIETIAEKIAENDYYKGHSTTSSYIIPVTNKLCIATLNESGTLSIEDLEDGKELHVIIKNNGLDKITITIPSDGYVNLNGGNTIDIEAEQYSEIYVISDGSIKYLRVG